MYSKQIGNRNIETELTWEDDYAQYLHGYVSVTSNNFQISFSLLKLSFIFAIYKMEPPNVPEEEEACSGSCEGCQCR